MPEVELKEFSCHKIVKTMRSRDEQPKMHKDKMGRTFE